MEQLLGPVRFQNDKSESLNALFVVFVPAGSHNRQPNPEQQTVRSRIQAAIIQALFNLNTKNR